MEDRVTTNNVMAVACRHPPLLAANTTVLNSLKTDLVSI